MYQENIYNLAIFRYANMFIIFMLILSIMFNDEMRYKICSIHSRTIYIVAGKPKKKKTPAKRSVSLSPLFKTIEEKVTEEELAGEESRSQEPSPLTQFYDSLKLKARHTWPRFLGDWAFKQTTEPNRTGEEWRLGNNYIQRHFRFSTMIPMKKPGNSSGCIINIVNPTYNVLTYYHKLAFPYQW